MAYLDVLPLAEAKVYLRIDDTQSETDAEITSMIKSALSYIEKHTNIIVSRQATKQYLVKNRCVRVYDHPINAVVKGINDEGSDVTLTYKTNYNKEEKTNYTNFYNIEGSAVKLVLDVGHVLPADVPTELIDLAKVMVDVMYNDAMNNPQSTTQSFKEMLPSWTIEMLNSNKRFIL